MKLRREKKVKRRNNAKLVLKREVERRYAFLCIKGVITPFHFALLRLLET